MEIASRFVRKNQTPTYYVKYIIISVVPTKIVVANRLILSAIESIC